MALFTRLQELFAADPFIDEIGLVLGVDEPELTPESAFVLEDHKLGVALSAGPLLFRQARTRFHELNPLLRRTSDAGESLVADLIDCTRAVLLISADFYTAWNTRKELVCRGQLDALTETHFCDLVFSLHPKSIDTWAYRRWLATQLLAAASTDVASKAMTVPPLAREARPAFYRRQLHVCSLLAEQKPRNYHAWSFRHWIVSRLPQEDLADELHEMRRWCVMHITDHSGWNHRQHVVNESIRHLRLETVDSSSDAAVHALVTAEHAFVSELMAAFPTHEALWCHRRFVLQLLLTTTFRSTRRGASPASSEALERALKDVEVRVVSRAVTSGNTSPVLTTEQLTSAWRGVNDALRTREATTRSERVLLAIVQEIDVAWSVGSRFAQRFALWCLERVRVDRVRLEAEEASTIAAVDCLVATLRRQLQTNDPLLGALWRAASA